nr:MAG: hypothetical protein [Totiviridae sp.]
MGPVAVRHFAPYAPIPVIYREKDPVPKVRLVDFCLSWINGIAAGTLANLARILSEVGLCDRVDRWAVDGLTLYSNHAGIMAVAPVDPAARTFAPVTPAVAVEDTSTDEVPLLMRCWRDVGDRVGHAPSDADWTDWQPEADWALPLPDIRSAGLIVLGCYQFVTDTRDTMVHALLSSPYAGAAIHVAAQRRFIAWRNVHTETRASYETYQLAVDATSAGSAERRAYDNVFGMTVFQPGRYLDMISDALCAIHGAKALQVAPDMEASRFIARPVRWESNVWDLTNVRPLNKIIPGSLPDSVIYTWSREVPQEDMPFVITTKVEGATSALHPLKTGCKPPPVGYDGPFLEMQYYEDFLQINDLADPTVDDFWMNRLMHFMKDYFLGQFFTSVPAAGAPPPGCAPVPLTRRPDFWQRTPRVDATDVSATYPNVCTTWMPWTDGAQHQVIALLARHTDDTWFDLLRQGYAGRAAGIVFRTEAPPLRWVRTLTEAGPAMRAIEARWTKNGRGGAAGPMGRTDSPTASSDAHRLAPRPTQTPPAVHLPTGMPGLPDESTTQ